MADIVCLDEMVKILGVLSLKNVLWGFVNGGHSVGPLGVLVGYLFEGFAEICLFEIH